MGTNHDYATNNLSDNNFKQYFYYYVLDGKNIPHAEILKQFDKGRLTVINNFPIVYALISENCNENDNVRLFKIIENKPVLQGTIKSFKNISQTKFDREQKIDCFNKQS